MKSAHNNAANKEACRMAIEEQWMDGMTAQDDSRMRSLLDIGEHLQKKDMQYFLQSQLNFVRGYKNVKEYDIRYMRWLLQRKVLDDGVHMHDRRLLEEVRREVTEAIDGDIKTLVDAHQSVFPQGDAYYDDIDYNNVDEWIEAMRYRIGFKLLLHSGVTGSEGAYGPEVRDFFD